MNFIHHPLIRPEKLEERKYQLSIALRALDGNTMVVLPTGLGKTAVALITAASRVYNAGGKILMLAPTKPLVEQHYRFFNELFIEPENQTESGTGSVMFTGETKTDVRKETFNSSRLIFATPQVIKNDCIAGRYGLEDVSLLIIDECHRAVGNYSYGFIAGLYNKTAKKPLILAMTASPGSNQEKMMEVCENLDIKIIESRTEEDEDVRPYIHERDVHYIYVELPKELKWSVDQLKEILTARLEQLALMDFTVPKPDKLSMKSLNAINAQIQGRIHRGDTTAYMAASIHAEIFKIRHAISLAESQGSEVFKAYLLKLSAEGETASGTKASKRLTGSNTFLRVTEECRGWQNELHPKPKVVLQTVQKQLTEYPDSRIIIFATFRDTVNAIVDLLKENGIEGRRFVGQATKDSDKGLTQKKQIETLTQFREGEFKVLVATSVGEEGLDVPSTDMVIFYEAVPSEIRSIQRKGRTGRHSSGTIEIIVTKGTADETFRYISQAREKSMKKGIRLISGAPQITNVSSNMQTSIAEFVPAGPYIIVDDRETSSKVVECLHSAGADLELRRLEFGDYAIGNRILVERKTTRDFMDTLVERDLFEQIKKMADVATRPVLIIEGENLYTQRNIHPNSVRGMLAAIGIELGVTIFYTNTPEETAEMLYILAKREGGERGDITLHHRKSYRSEREQQEYIISAFPGIGLKNARLLLDQFGTIRDIINASEAELKSVNGIGEKIAKIVFLLSRRDYKNKS